MTSWTDPNFVHEADEWISTQIDCVGSIEQTHVEPWSTVFRIGAPEGPFWFKASNEPTESRLVLMLSRAKPEMVPRAIAVDEDRGWMLMRDAGTRLRELVTTPDDLWHWEALLPRYADLQIEMAPYAEVLSSIGLATQPVAALAEEVAGLLEQPELLMLDEPDGLTGLERAHIEALLPDIADMASRLASFGIPETVQHDDLHDGNVFVDDGKYRILDWGDACISHPLHTATVTLRATAYSLDLEPGGRELLRMRDAYLEPFSRYGTREELEEVAELAYRTGTLARALAWARFSSTMTEEDAVPHLEAIPYGLKKFLEKGPVGSW